MPEKIQITSRKQRRKRRYLFGINYYLLRLSLYLVGGIHLITITNATSSSSIIKNQTDPASVATSLSKKPIITSVLSISDNSPSKNVNSAPENSLYGDEYRSRQRLSSTTINDGRNVALSNHKRKYRRKLSNINAANGTAPHNIPVPQVRIKPRRRRLNSTTSLLEDNASQQNVARKRVRLPTIGPAFRHRPVTSITIMDPNAGNTNNNIDGSNLKHTPKISLYNNNLLNHNRKDYRLKFNPAAIETSTATTSTKNTAIATATAKADFTSSFAAATATATATASVISTVTASTTTTADTTDHYTNSNLNADKYNAKKDQLIIRENTDIVFYHKYPHGTIIPCPPSIRVIPHHIRTSGRPRFRECMCNPDGSAAHICDYWSGQCACNNNVTGRRCDRCQPGNWNLTADIGCVDCQCNSIGSRSNECNQWTGQCDCKIGVGGRRCDQCHDGFYGFSAEGCTPCEQCQSEGHVCDPLNGRCICSNNSYGLDCKQCVAGTWGWRRKIGCEGCDCDLIGSIGQVCNTVSGQCTCREGYASRRCDMCAVGYFGYPDCQRCNCNPDGSQVHDGGELIGCDLNGHCSCKSLVIGEKCDQCAPSSFGLSRINPVGCTRCFCFGRSTHCSQSDWSWGHIRMPGARNLSVQYINPSGIPNTDYDYIVVVQMEGTKFHREDAEISTMNGLNLIPSSTGNVSIGAYTIFYYPLYFQLPPQFYGDKVTSYGGRITFSLSTEDASSPIDPKVLQKSPIVQIHAHNKLVLDYYELENPQNGFNVTYSVPLHESYWRHHHNGNIIDRTVMMTALQNVRHIFLRATYWADFSQVVIHNVHMDTAIFVSGTTTALSTGVEKCSCPNQFAGLSCQDPSDGHFRWKNVTDDGNVFLEDLIGRSIPCQCNDRSEKCDRETGVCLNCREFTGGNHCEKCAEGYYGDPTYGTVCQPCPCPETSRNFAKGCTVWKGEVSCICKPGYTGSLCDKCRSGYFGFPYKQNGTCESCDCNGDGIVSDECDSETGQCNCRPGVTGLKCDTCEAERHILEESRCKVCDNCTIILLDYVDLIAHKLRRELIHLDLNGIPAPWLTVEAYENDMNKLSDHLLDFSNTVEVIRNYDVKELEKIHSYSENTMFQSRKLEGNSKKQGDSVLDLETKANEFFIEIGSINADIREAIFELDSYGTKSYHLSLPNALEQTKYYLNEIMRHDQSVSDMKSAWQCAWDYFYHYGNASDAAFDQKAEVEILWRDLNHTNYRITDIQRNADIIIDNLKETDDLNEHIVNIKSYLVEDYGQIGELHNQVNGMLSNNYGPETEVNLDIIDSEVEQMSTQIASLNELMTITEENFSEDDHIRRDIKKHWIPKLEKHASRLTERSNAYAKQFQTTKDGARLALLASGAYQNITDAIDDAKRASIEAKERAYDAQSKLYPEDDESVIDRAKVSLDKSKLLQRDALSQMKKSSNLLMQIESHEDRVDNIKTTIWDAGIKTNNISSSFSNFHSNSAKVMAHESIDIAKEISNKMREEQRIAADITNDVYKMRKKFSSMEPDWDSKLGMAEENISQTLSNIRRANISLTNVEDQAFKAQEKFDVWNNTMSKQLQDLRDLIAKARHAAEGIKVSLDSLSTKCVRSYLPGSYGLSTSNMFKMSFALNNRIGNSPLIYLQGRDGRYISLELYKRRVRLLWNLGGTTGIVTHPLEVQTRDPKYDDAWYHIEANRTLNVGSLLVRRMTNNGVLNEGSHVSGATDYEFTRFFRTSMDRIWLGGVPEDLKPKELQSSDGLNVVVHQVHVDNRPLGLWNFISSEGGCAGAMLGATESNSASNARHFNGLGYAQVTKSRPRPYRRNLFALQMTFKTLDENALLFLAVDNKNNRSVSVTLSTGRILFRIDYGDESKLEINTTKKHNTGKWVKIEAAREFVPKRGTENGILRVNSDNPITGSPTVPINSHMLPDLSKPIYYLGGVPPGFKSGTTKAPGADNPFLGCMMDVQINGETYDPLESTSFFGVEQSCKDVVTKAGFYGNGFIELPSQSLRKRSNTGLVFRTLQPECLLLLSAYPPAVDDDYDAKDIKGNYSISLLDGRVHVWINSGRNSTKLISNQTVNDGEYHVLSLIKNGRKLELMVDDEPQDIKHLGGSPTLISMPKDAGGLYIGGAPDYPQFRQLVPTFIGLEGSIRDLVFNNRTLTFNQALSFSNAQIGRNGPQMGAFNGLMDVLMKTEPIGKSFTAAPEGCHRVGSYSYEPNAFKFGDYQISYAQLNIPIRNVWQRNFHIEFDFRTFYPNGVLFVAPGIKEKHKHYVSLILKDGNLSFIVRGRRREELNLTAKLNNGEWHHVVITCVERKVTMSVEIGATDQKTSVQMKVPKKISASNLIYVGGLPETALKLPPELLVKIEGFKGCLRKFSVNNATQDLARPEKHINVGQCFPKIEKGSYFPGDAYAIYKKNFHVGKYLEINMEFKTSELNGVLLSVSEPVGFPALSLEINNGNIILSCDMGDGNPFRVESLLPSKYAICDNKWHNISALYDFEQINLRIDNHPPMMSLAQHRVSGKIQTKSSLYIGGIPDIVSSGTLLTRDNFKGCIRNVSIRNERRDWTDMEGLHNVLLSECLVVN